MNPYDISWMDAPENQVRRPISFKARVFGMLCLASGSFGALIAAAMVWG